MGKKERQYGVDATISIDINVSLIMNAGDEDEAHTKYLAICEKITESIDYRIQETLKATRFEVKELDDITETYHQDTSIENIEEIEAPSNEEEEG